MKAPTRRHFLARSAQAAAAVALLPHARSAPAANRVIVGVMGTGGRGTQLTKFFAARDDCRIAWVCDADRRRAERAREAVVAQQRPAPRVTQDFRRILDDAEVDVLINATPDHWHALGTILACQAGKDVYVEKPMAHNLREGRRMIETARQHGRVVQVGMQSRSAPYLQEAVELVRSGRLGQVHLVRVFNMMRHGPMQPGPDEPPPPELDYDLWCGPAAKLPYNPRRRWLNFFEYSCGPIPGDAIHQLDLARWLMGDPPPPTSVSQQSGIFALQDGRDTPDSQMAGYDCGPFTLTLEATLWTPYEKKIPQRVRNSDELPDWPFCSTRIEVCGTDGFLYVGRHGGGWELRDRDGRPVQTRPGRQADREHQDNFLDCVRSRQRPHADVEIGHHSALLCHLANAAWRAGQPGLRFDARSESFPDADAANRFLGRAYRAPWRLPERV